MPSSGTGGIVAQERIEPTANDNFATYPLLQLGVGFGLLRPAVRAALAGELKTQAYPAGPSKLWSHPTLASYLIARWRKGREVGYGIESAQIASCRTVLPASATSIRSRSFSSSRMIRCMLTGPPIAKQRGERLSCDASRVHSGEYHRSTLQFTLSPDGVSTLVVGLQTLQFT